jgi:hypothetical protein
MQEKGKNSELMLNCSVCSEAIEERGTVLVDEKEARTIFHTTCQKCLTATLIFISRTEKGMMSVGMATDLDRIEVQEMFGGKAISADEVIEVYRLMNERGEKIK